MVMNAIIPIDVNDVIIKPSEFRLFKNLMYELTGVNFTDIKIALVNSRLKARLRIYGLKNFRSYYEYIIKSENRDELQKCINLLTTNETFFFRHKEHWDFIMEEIIPEWKRRTGSSKIIRAWSAAASTGEEAYSCAIALYVNFINEEDWNIHVDATDINLDVLEKAKRGVYSFYSLQKLTSLCLHRCFIKAPPSKKYSKQYKLLPEIMNMVTFKQHNLLNDYVKNKYDLIFLRNVMIYFDAESKDIVIENISDALRKGGYLFLGGAETLTTFRNKFTQIKPSIYRKTQYE